MEKPKQKEDKDIDLKELKSICEDAMYNRHNEDSDMEHYIFETAMETIYGKDMWEFYNS
jgi:hypothetical protein